MRRAMGLDVGEKRIGVALSDPLGLTAQGLTTINSEGMERDIARVRALAEQHDVDQIVVGLPKNMEGSEGFQAERVRAFAGKVEQLGYRVIYQDERLTTASARRTLIEGNVRRDKRRQVIDKLAAVYILQGFLDSGGLC